MGGGGGGGLVECGVMGIIPLYVEDMSHTR